MQQRLSGLEGRVREEERARREKGYSHWGEFRPEFHNGIMEHYSLFMHFSLSVYSHLEHKSMRKWM
jgi:hypothetical protein